MSKRCYIAGAGEFCDNELPAKNDYIIAANGGYTALKTRSVPPDLIVGDFDSLGEAPDHPNIVQSSAEKDDTDMMLAVKQGLERGYKTFIINGGLGGRLDQTLANIQILVYIAENYARGTLLGLDTCVTVIKNGRLEYKKDAAPGSTISIFCAGGKAEGVTLRGLKYPLDNATLTSEYPLGVSNEFTGEPAVISVDSGALIIIWDGGLNVINHV